MEEIYKLLFSVILGFLIGLEREISGKSIGIRTVSLITLGSTLFALISINIIPADHSRTIAQIVSGISFICAGVIIKDGATIKGLTTGATLWVAAAIGAAIGIDMFSEAFIVTIIVIVINLGFTYFKKLTNGSATRRKIEESDE